MDRKDKGGRVMRLTDSKKEIPSLTGENSQYWREVYFKLKSEDYTGKKVINKNSGAEGIIIRVNENGSIQVLEKVSPRVVCTHDSWSTLEIIDD